MKKQTGDILLRKIASPPLAGEDPETLILGTLPGDESLLHCEYYRNRRNRFWKVFASLTRECLDLYADKERALMSRRIALWTVLESAERKGSTNRKLHNVKPNDIRAFLQKYPTINTIVFNGRDAEKYFSRYFATSFPTVCRVVLPSTSSTNTHETEVSLRDKWKDIFR